MKPVKPDPTDCCGSGCTPCVYDVYEEELRKWEKKSERSECSEGWDALLRNDLLCKLKYSPFRMVQVEVMSTDVYLYRFQPYLPHQNPLASEQSRTLDSDVDIFPGLLNYRPSQHFIMRLPRSKSSGTTFCSTQTDLKSPPAIKPLDPSPPCNLLSAAIAKESLDVPDELLVKNQSSFISRAYTPISLSSEERNCCFEIIIKHYVNGEMSSHLKDLRLGDLAHFRGPYGGFKHCPSSYSSLTLICAGTGIAPMISLIKSIVNDDNDETLVLLLFTVSCFQNILLRHQILNFCRNWNVTAKVYLTNECNWNEVQPLFRHDEIIINQRINKDIISSEVLTRKNNQILICGPTRFCEEVQNWLLETGREALEQKIFVF